MGGKKKVIHQFASFFEASSKFSTRSVNQKTKSQHFILKQIKRCLTKHNFYDKAFMQTKELKQSLLRLSFRYKPFISDQGDILQK